MEGIDYQHRGHVDIQLLRSTLKLMRYQFYVCGPKPMMEALVPALEEWGVAPGDIHYESFGPASLTKQEKSAKAGTQIIRVTFSKTGWSIAWDRGADSLLEFAETHGIAVESGCRAGSWQKIWVRCQMILIQICCWQRMWAENRATCGSSQHRYPLAWMAPAVLPALSRWV